MMAKGRTCLVIGGSGYIGSSLAERMLRREQFERIFLLDIVPPKKLVEEQRIEFFQHDIRNPVDLSGLPIEEPIDWIFHFAAVHREPGHESSEYFRTNVPSARNVIAFANAIRCKNIFFTSSIAVYGPTAEPTDESASLEPISPYGISKLCSELILEKWLAEGPARRLVTVRPGVIYGPGDPGNVGRLIRAVQRGRFVYPGNREIRKSYGYIEGLLDSIEFAMNRSDASLTYNYVERETLPLKKVVDAIATFVGKRAPKLTIPRTVLEAAARGIQLVTCGQSAIHPQRVRKAAMQTWIVPQKLMELGFDFRYDFASSLQHWRGIEPEFFCPYSPTKLR